MGKGNKHRGGRSRDQRDDRGSDKEFAQQAPFRSFGGSSQRHASTIGGQLGQSERHSQEHYGMITTMQDLRKKTDALEKSLKDGVPDYPAYIKAKREMLDLEKKLRLNPQFVEFQKLKVELRTASSKFDEAKPRCTKCSFVKPLAAAPTAGTVATAPTTAPTP